MAKPALVVQGGGMRGVYSIGALAELESEGLRDAFSVVVGSSAGAINGAYFLAGQANVGERIYVDDLSHKAFINPARLWKVVDVDYLIDEVVKEHYPLDVVALKSAPAELLTVLTDAETGEAFVVSNREADDLHEVLRATAALPALYNKRIPLGGRRYIDGGIVAPVPVDQALEAGATQALVVMTRSFTFLQDDLGAAMKWLGRRLARGQADFVKENISRPSPHYAALLQRLAAEHTVTPRVTWTVAPSEIRADRTGIDASVLAATARLGRSDMRAMLDQEFTPGQ
ncbi:patatin-like phospholipase family protein [Kineosporia succinea]|uniref:Patatin/cPLA2 family phospholipase n=1 Tax=Kineosporia succinea TaxID=84632 RepID=A0ABT9P5F3_9ACTN|nr:patatin family protein [Kineosporia succinea]MDP9827918.1 putative patatin/cPLA2 family phospholipase [Kineosporia succinea]